MADTVKELRERLENIHSKLREATVTKNGCQLTEEEVMDVREFLDTFLYD